MQPADPLLEIVIVTTTGAHDHVSACLRSLEENPLTTGPSSVHVVDNASIDGTREMIREKFPWVDLIELDWNAGFSIANNVALRRARARYLLLLNPDTVIYPGALDHMVSVMESRPDVGMSSCRLAKPDGTFDHASKRGFPSPLGALAEFVGVGRNGRPGMLVRRLADYRAHSLGEHEAGEVDAVNGAFMLVRSSVIEQVGLLDEVYWLYMEDLDWCYRFKQQGWKVWYDGSVTVMHVKGGTSMVKRHRPLRANLAFHRGMGRFYRKFHAGERPLVDVAIYFALGLKLAVSVARSAAARRQLT